MDHTKGAAVVEEKVRVSVRELVAFTYFEPDIVPAADASALLAGTRAHQARQADSEGETEKTIKHVFEADGIPILVFGRMDAFVYLIYIVSTLLKSAVCFFVSITALKTLANRKI